MQSIVETSIAAQPRNVSAQLISLWSAPIFGAILLVAFLTFPGFFPPMSPEMGPEQVADFYTDNTALIRFSMVVFNLCAIMLMPFFAVLVVQIKRMATPSQVLAYCYLTAATSGATLFALADLFWLIAAFRPERNPALTVLLNDMAWMTFIAPVGFLVVQNLCLALAVYLDAGPVPVFPRWIAPFSIATAAAMIPSACAALVRTGPLAWDGVVSFWLRNTAFALFVAVMFFVARTAIKREVTEQQVRR